LLINNNKPDRTIIIKLSLDFLYTSIVYNLLFNNQIKILRLAVSIEFVNLYTGPDSLFILTNSNCL